MAKLTEEQKKARAKKREENKAKKEEEQNALHFALEKERFIKKMLKSTPQTPKRTFKLKENVRILNDRFDTAVVSEVLADGRAYVLDVTLKQNKERETKTIKSKMIFRWYDLTYLDAKECDTSYNHRHNFLRSFQNFNMQISSLIDKVESQGVEFNPDYQRELVWTLQDKQELVDSMLHHRDIGKFSFVFLGYDSEKMYEILDGKQRLSTIMEFIMDGFKYKGNYYSELNIQDKRAFEDLAVAVSETRSVLTSEQKYIAFLDMNTRGQVQNKEHIEYVRNLLEKK